MSDDPIYELARKRVNQRIHPWILLGVNFFAFMVYVGIIVVLYNVIPHNLGAFGALIWLGVLVLHAVLLVITQNRDEAIEQEVARLRDLVYEKPKRLDLGDDGELLEMIDDETEGDDVQEQKIKRS
jgi:hypothetical protein